DSPAPRTSPGCRPSRCRRGSQATGSPSACSSSGARSRKGCCSPQRTLTNRVMRGIGGGPEPPPKPPPPRGGGEDGDGGSSSANPRGGGGEDEDQGRARARSPGHPPGLRAGRGILQASRGGLQIRFAEDCQGSGEVGRQPGRAVGLAPGRADLD